MSYCRFGPDSDAYVYESGGGGWVCCSCLLTQTDEVWSRFETREAMRDHLLAHRKAGHRVPDYAIERLETEISS